MSCEMIKQLRPVFVHFVDPKYHGSISSIIAPPNLMVGWISIFSWPSLRFMNTCCSHRYASIHERQTYMNLCVYVYIYICIYMCVFYPGLASSVQFSLYSHKNFTHFGRLRVTQGFFRLGSTFVRQTSQQHQMQTSGTTGHFIGDHQVNGLWKAIENIQKAIENGHL